MATAPPAHVLLRLAAHSGIAVAPATERPVARLAFGAIAGRYDPRHPCRRVHFDGWRNGRLCPRARTEFGAENDGVRAAQGAIRIARELARMRLGLLGCGSAAYWLHLPALRKIAGVILAAAADP